MQACSISSYRSLLLLEHPLSLCPRLPLLHLSPTPHFHPSLLISAPLLPRFPTPPFISFQAWRPVSPEKGKKTTTKNKQQPPSPPKKPQLYVHMMQCVSTWVSNFVCVWTWAAVLGASGRESMCSEGGACVWGVCALLSSCTHASMSECVQDRGEWRCGGGRGSVGSSDQGCGFYTARGSKPQQAQRWLTSQPLWPQNCCFSSSVFHQHNLPEPSTHQFSSFYSTTSEYI